MSLYKKFGVSKDIVDIEVDKNVFFSIRRIGPNNKKYAEIFSKLRKPHERAIKLETLDPEINKSIIIKSFVLGALVDWKNVNDEDGKPLEFSSENAISLFKKLPDLFLALQEESEKLSNFQEAEIEDIAKK